MDFSGRIGRVIDNPVEAQSAAMEEGHAWRVRDARLLLPVSFFRILAALFMFAPIFIES